MHPKNHMGINIETKMTKKKMSNNIEFLVEFLLEGIFYFIFYFPIF